MKNWIGLLIAGFISIAGRAQTELPLEFKAAPGAESGCQCSSGGFPVSVTLQWRMASCKYECRNGWGMDCGLSWVLLCSNGQRVVCPITGNCRSVSSDYLRQVSATETFLSNGSLRLQFQSELPPAEKGQGGFEVPSVLTIPLPAGLTIGGRSYSAFRILPGVYAVEEGTGKWGSVTLKVELVE